MGSNRHVRWDRIATSYGDGSRAQGLHRLGQRPRRCRRQSHGTTETDDGHEKQGERQIDLFLPQILNVDQTWSGKHR